MCVCLLYYLYAIVYILICMCIYLLYPYFIITNKHQSGMGNYWLHWFHGGLYHAFDPAMIPIPNNTQLIWDMSAMLTILRDHVHQLVECVNSIKCSHPG